jgi:hypothetical protein
MAIECEVSTTGRTAAPLSIGPIETRGKNLAAHFNYVMSVTNRPLV